jgi:hypothetical protein
MGMSVSQQLCQEYGWSGRQAEMTEVVTDFVRRNRHRYKNQRQLRRAARRYARSQAKQRYGSGILTAVFVSVLSRIIAAVIMRMWSNQNGSQENTTGQAMSSMPEGAEDGESPVGGFQFGDTSSLEPCSDGDRDVRTDD